MLSGLPFCVISRLGEAFPALVYSIEHPAAGQAAGGCGAVEVPRLDLAGLFAVSADARDSGFGIGGSHVMTTLLLTPLVRP